MKTSSGEWMVLPFVATPSPFQYRMNFLRHELVKKQRDHYFHSSNRYMQTLPSVSVSTADRNDAPWRGPGVLLFLSRRMAPGFRIGELLAWTVFHLSWPLILAVIYTATGKFSNPGFMTLDRFLSIQGFVVSGKALFLLPLWWLYFVKLKNLAFSKKIVFHFFTAAVYIAFCLGYLSFALTRILEVPYSRNDRINDIYHLLLFYLLNFAIFYTYNFWLHAKVQLKKEQALRELAYQSEIQALKAQIEPHFLFNTLNSISASVPPQMEQTRVLIAQLADTFRYALRVSESVTVTLGDELEFLKTWLALEKHRFGRRLTVHYDIDPRALNATIPPMLLQPLVENALNHGIAQRVEGGSVTIRCAVTNDESVLISVQDTGVGYTGDLDHIMNKGIGLSNTAKRLQLLYNQSIRIERLPRGLSFSFHLPLNTSA
jgi:hypothetical protein